MVKNFQVSILVLVDLALEFTLSESTYATFIVSILVLVDLALELSLLGSLGLVFSQFQSLF